MSEQKDRPELRDKIARLEIVFCFALIAYDEGYIKEGEIDLYRDDLLDQILALIPNIEQTDAMLVEARRTAKNQERERIEKAVELVLRRELGLIEMGGAITTCQGKLTQEYIDFKIRNIKQALKEE